MPPAKKAPARASTAAKKTARKAAAAPVPDEAPVDAPSVDAPPVAEAPSSTIRRCGECGYALLDELITDCPTCGRPLAGGPALPSEPKMVTPVAPTAADYHQRRVVAAVVAAVVLAIVVGLIVVVIAG